MNNIKFKNNQIIISKKLNMNLTKEENESFLFFGNELEKILLEEMCLDFFKSICEALLKINKYEITKPKILIGANKKNSLCLLFKKILNKNGVVYFNKEIREFKKQVKLKYCTMGLYILETNNRIILNMVGANGMNLHEEQMSKLKFFCKNSNK